MTDLDDFEAALRLASTGDLTCMEGPLQAFREEVDDALAPVGLSATGDAFDADLERLGFAGDLPVAPTREPIAITAAAVAVVVFVGLALGQWAVERVADRVWKRLSPSLGRLFSRAAAEKPASPLVVSLSAWFAESKVMVVVETMHQDGLDTIMSNACQRAVTWLVDNPRDGVKLIYRFADGALSDEPVVKPV